MNIKNIYFKSASQDLSKTFYDEFGETNSPHSFEELLKGQNYLYNLFIIIDNQTLRFTLLENMNQIDTVYERDENGKIIFDSSGIPEYYDLYSQNIIYNIKGKIIQDLSLKELFEIKTIFEQSIEFVKNRMRKNIINESDDSLIKIDEKNINKIEELLKETMILLNYKERKIEDKLKKYNLK